MPKSVSRKIEKPANGHGRIVQSRIIESGPRSKRTVRRWHNSWVKRLDECLHDLTSDVPDASAAERSIMRRAAVLQIECERLESKFALAGEAVASDLDLYIRASGNLKRLLEAVGLQRRQRDITPSLQEYLANRRRQHHQINGEAAE